MADRRKRRETEREADRDVELLAPGLVHEMRQPLMGADAGLKLIARELGDTVTGLEAWSLVVGQIARLDETLRSYGDLMQPSRGAGRAFPFEPVVRQALDLLRYRLRRLGPRFSVVVEEGVGDAFGAPSALLHAVTNLVVNALDALEGKESGRLEVRLLPGRGPVPRPQVRVADEGGGIADAIRPHLFQAHFTTKPPDRGSGLGLTIARRMMRACQGEVRLVAPDDPDRREWARTEFSIELAAHRDDSAPHAPAGKGRGRKVRGAVTTVVVAVAILAALAGGWSLFRGWVRANDPVPVRAALPAPAATVLAAEGGIERLVGDRWQGVSAGEQLHADDTIRTGDGAQASLAIGGSSRLTVAERTQLTVREITAAVQRLRLVRGRIAVDHQSDGARVLVVESDRGDAVARTAAARFSVLSTGAALAVATESGVVRLQASGSEVAVHAGERSVAFQGSAPLTPARIPVDVILRVAAAVAPAAEVADLCAVVRGKVEPGAEVLVEGVPVDPAPDGTFEVRVPRAKERTHARVATRDVSGRVVERLVACAARKDPSVTDFAVKWHDGAQPTAAK